MTKLKRMFIEIRNKKILMGEVEVFENFDAPLDMVNPKSVDIGKIKLFRKEGDEIDLK